MSTVTFTRSSSAARYQAIVLSIDIPSVATRDASTSGRGNEHVDRGACRRAADAR